MERSLKHMPVISKVFQGSSPSVFGPYIIGIQSGKYGIHSCSDRFLDITTFSS